MNEIRRIYKPGLLNTHGHKTLVMKVLDQIWGMISASAVSGQMSFKNITQDTNDYYIQNFDEACPLPDDWKEWGATTDGHVLQAHREVSHDFLIKATRNSLRILGKVVADNAFLTAEEKLPVVSDGPTNFEVAVVARERYWRDGEGDPKKDEVGKVIFRELETRKHYKVIYDPVQLGAYGDILTPIPKILELVDENQVVFADPFEVRNTARKQGNANEVKTIRPGLRQKVRKIVGKKMASEINLVDEVTQ